MSNIGEKCLRKLWYIVNKPEAAEPLPPWTRLKFLYGDIIEQVIFFLSKIAGHQVAEEQAVLKLYGIRGHKDGNIDNVLVDVKSASSFGFEKFRRGLQPSEDSFGYLTQLGAYARADERSERAFVAVDKSSGEICLDKHYEEDKTNYEELIDQARRATNLPEPPERYYRSEPEGKSGNEKLGVSCSYCQFKKECWPTVRGFAYSRGPIYLVDVKRLPDVPEIPL